LVATVFIATVKLYHTSKSVKTKEVDYLLTSPPFLPLSLKGEGEKEKEGLTPLLDTPKVRELKRGEASLN